MNRDGEMEHQNNNGDANDNHSAMGSSRHQGKLKFDPQMTSSFSENDRLFDREDDTGSNRGSQSDLDIGFTRKPNKRAKSIKMIEAEKDEFTKNFNNLQPN